MMFLFTSIEQEPKKKFKRLENKSKQTKTLTLDQLQKLTERYILGILLLLLSKSVNKSFKKSVQTMYEAFSWI